VKSLLFVVLISAPVLFDEILEFGEESSNQIACDLFQNVVNLQERLNNTQIKLLLEG
jgi:hypothetical protein